MTPPSRLVAGVIAALLLSACSLTSAPRDGGAVKAGPVALPEPVSESGGQPPAAEMPDRPVPEVLAQPAAGGLLPVTFQGGDTLASAGVYFLDTRTGLGEGWTPQGNPPFWGAQVTGDNRFITAPGGYLVDRQSKGVWQWDPARVRLLLADAGGFLFAEVQEEEVNGVRPETGRLFWAEPDMKPRRVFTLSNGPAWSGPALRSPDGRRLAVVYRAGSSELALLDLEAGEVRWMETRVANVSTAATLRRWGDQFQIEQVVSSGHANRPSWSTVITRFDWQGETVEELRIPSLYPFFSPDGRWLAWGEWPAGDLAPVAVVADAATLKPHLQVLGATTCFSSTGGGGTRWLADSSGLVLDTSDGYRLLTLDGRLEQPPGFQGLDWKAEPQPAPDQVDRFALGRQAITDGAGLNRVGVTLEGFVTPSSLPPWGNNSAELRLSLPPKPAGGACMERPPMAAQVIHPARPLPAFPLVVQSPNGCLEWEPQEPGDAAACLPNGTRLAAVREREDSPSTLWYGQAWWLSVKTEKGETGRIPLDGNPIAWAVE